jgi:hypothetical protein
MAKLETRWQALPVQADLVRLAREKGLPDDFFKFSLWYATFDTNESADRQLLQAFLMDPGSFLPPPCAAGGGGLDLAPMAKGPDYYEDPSQRAAGWKVVTKINNHHMGLNPRIVFSSITLDPESPTVHLTLHKQNA